MFHVKAIKMSTWISYIHIFNYPVICEGPAFNWMALQLLHSLHSLLLLNPTHCRASWTATQQSHKQETRSWQSSTQVFWHHPIICTSLEYSYDFQAYCRIIKSVRWCWFSYCCLHSHKWKRDLLYLRFTKCILTCADNSFL